jgi:hypothetical protein
LSGYGTPYPERIALCSNDCFMILYAGYIGKSQYQDN